MGNCWCCRSESPCGTVEERSGLLNDDSKATVCTGSKAVVGSCGPEGSDKREKKDEKDKQLKPSPENREPAPKNTQENGPLKKESIQTVMLSPCRVSEGNATRAQQIKETPAQRGQDELTLQSTSGSLQKDFTKVDWVVFDRSNTEGEYPALVQDKIPDVTPVIPEVLCPHTDTEATEHITMRTTHHDAEEEEKVTSEAVTKPSGEFSQNNKVVSVPNTHLTAVPDQVSSISGVNQEPKPESPTCAVSEVPDNNREAGPEVLQSHDVFQSSSGLEPSGLGHSGEEWDCASSLREPETTAPADASESLESDPDKMPDPECTTLLEEEVTSLEKSKQEAEEEVMLKVQDKDVPKAKEEDNGIKEEKAEAESGLSETKTGAGKDAETEEVTGEGAQLSETTAKDVEAENTEKEDNLENSEEDLYRGEEELSASQSNKPGPPPELETKFLKVEDRCSLSPAVNILSYSEREWKGNTAKSALIKKGYKEMSQRFDSVRRVRGDNYCALRATLFQVLSHSTQLPAWLKDEDIIMLPKQLEAQEGLISEWTFPGECLQGDGTGDTIQQLKGYMELLCNTWQEAVDCASNTERQQLCERVFQGGEEELGLLEALKLLMLSRAVELHSCMRDGGDVPLFCWLLFARDSSDCPRSFLSNHLNHVGLTAGLEQVEMFLLGYALQCTIQVYRLYKADTEEFVTYYPDDHKDDWQSVCLVTEDDRHYNVPVVEAAEIQKELPSS